MIDLVAAINDKTSIHNRFANVTAKRLLDHERYTSLNNGVLRWLPSFEVPTENVLKLAKEIGIEIDIDACNAARGSDALPSLGDLRISVGTGSMLATLKQNAIYMDGRLK